MNDRKGFKIEEEIDSDYEGLLSPGKKKNKKKTVSISGEDVYSQSIFAGANKVSETKKKKRGRPVEIMDERYQVVKPKKISPALDSKLKILQDYIEELQTESGRITFEKLVDTLAEAYISQRLSMTKEEHLRSEIQDGFEKLNK